MKSSTKIALCITSFVLLSSCGFKIDKTQTTLNPNGAISYADVSKAIFNPSCVACHNASGASGGVALDTYDHVKSALPQVNDEVSGGTMPPSGPLNANEQEYLAAWIQNGAPETASTGGTTTSPTPSPTPGSGTGGSTVNYAMIRTQVLNNKCIVCHGASGSESRLPFDTYSSLMDDGIVTAGSPSQSSFYNVMKNGSMPPRSSGIAAVTPSELTLISNWITQGALQ